MTRTWHAGGAWLPLVITAGLAAVHLPYPFFGDQAFTLVAAQVLDRSGTLYVDFWDIRQPGAAWFTWIAGRLLGFTEWGVHAAELVWMLVTAALVMVIARRLLSRSWLAVGAPLVTVGMYYVHTTQWELTQPEGLALLPLTVCFLVALAGVSDPARRVWYFWVLGCAAGVVALFKLALLVIPITMSGAAVAWIALTERNATRTLVKVIAAAVMGLALVMALVVLHFWRRDALDALFWTTFECPGLVVLELPRAPRTRLIASAWSFITPWLPWTPFLVAGLVRRARPNWLHIALLSAWLGSGLAAIIVQRQGWWPYHFLVLIVPMGLLGLRGLDVALDLLRIEPGRGATRIALVVFPLMLASYGPLGPKLGALTESWLAEGRFVDDFQARIDPGNSRLKRSAALISGPDALPGTAFVFGDPRLLLFSGRQQAIATRGWGLITLLRRQWDALPEQLSRAAPAYIYVSRNDASAVSERSPGVLALLDRSYQVRAVDELGGVWHERIDARAKQD